MKDKKEADFALFLALEKKYNMYEKNILNCNYWNFIRFDIWAYNICPQILKLDPRELKKNKNCSFISLIKEKLKIIKHLNYLRIKYKLPNKKIDILLYSHERRVKVNEYYECKYTECLSDYFSNSMTLEDLYITSHLTPTRNKKLYYADDINKKAFGYYKLYSIVYSFFSLFIKRKIKKQLSDFLENISSEFNWRYDLKLITNKVYEIILCHKATIKCQKEFLLKLKPKIIVEVVHYNFHKMTINEVAKELNIPTVELQHGVINSKNIAYHYASSKKISVLPDYIFLFADYWKKNLKVPLDQDRLIATGFPFFDKNVSLYISKKNSSEKIGILFLSQVHVGSYLSKIAENLSRALSNDKFEILYKLHPAEYTTYTEKYSNLLGTNIKIIANNRELYDCFTQCKIQIGCYSTALYEGIGFGLNTLILRKGHYDAMNDLVLYGVASYVDNVADILDYIEKFKSKQFSFNSLYNKDFFWKTNSLQNIIDEINIILKKYQCKTI